MPTGGAAPAYGKEAVPLMRMAMPLTGGMPAWGGAVAVPDVTGSPPILWGEGHATP